MDTPNFWDHTHPLSADYERLIEELMPAVGNCDTLQGEALRAASKIGYDWYNNGWGCNNWSGAVVFLRDHIAQLTQGRTEDEMDELTAALQNVHQFSHGEPAYVSDLDADSWVTTIAAHVTQCVLNNPAPIPNEKDMWEFGEPDAPYEEDDYDLFGDDDGDY